MKECVPRKAWVLIISGLLLFALSLKDANAATKLVEVDDDDFKTGIGNLAPGDSFETGIEVRNVSQEDVDYVISLKRAKESEQQRDKGSKMFFENLQVVITVDGKQRYEGSFAGVDDIDMGQLGENERLPVTFAVLFPPESGNEYQGLSTTVSVKVDAAQAKSSEEDEDHSEESGESEDTGNPPENSDDPGEPDSGGPGEPENPDDPAQPDKPSEDPAQPEGPQQPDEPGDHPSQPGDPDEGEPTPGDPDDPEEEETVIPGGNDGPRPGFLPQTGETGPLLFYLFGTFAMAAGIYLYRTTLPVKTSFLWRYRRM
ncbi:LPXTG cell wall anchor domain-containing protein [Salibacterium aidingense]|uniref:LPXTG cell wall anchor domain-containing protein n=1 Tax=Salibacterium aidingense TaxID=384933 RepID=UPI003BECE2E8